MERQLWRYWEFNHLRTPYISLQTNYKCRFESEVPEPAFSFRLYLLEVALFDEQPSQGK